MLQSYRKTLSLFDEKTEKNLLLLTFYQTDLGQLYQSLPLKELAFTIPPPASAQSGRGRPPWFTVEGGLALMVLKNYLGLSDAMLVKRINTDWSLQLFCGIDLKGRKIRDKNIVSDWRCYLSQHLAIDQMQRLLANHWKPYMHETHVGMSDATVYESYIAFPTDTKLLWDAATFIYERIIELCQLTKTRKPRIRYSSQQNRYDTYQRKRKKSKKKEKRVRKSLVCFITRLLTRLDELITLHGEHLLSKRHQQRLKTIRLLYHQQKTRVEQPGAKIQDRIVSLHKPYLRPIVRGKEVKAVEFGAKVNLLQIDGINFIEHLSFDAYNEGTRLRSSIWQHRDLVGSCHQFAADKIYATNDNRKYCRQQGIATCFVPKGKEGAYEHQNRLMRMELGKQRATVLEGSFGNEKNHYFLHKIKARRQDTEVLWIFFGVVTCNAVQITRRRARERPRAKMTA